MAPIPLEHYSTTEPILINKSEINEDSVVEQMLEQRDFLVKISGAYLTELRNQVSSRTAHIDEIMKASKTITDALACTYHFSQAQHVIETIDSFFPEERYQERDEIRISQATYTLMAHAWEIAVEHLLQVQDPESKNKLFIKTYNLLIETPQRAQSPATKALEKRVEEEKNHFQKTHIFSAFLHIYPQILKTLDPQSTEYSKHIGHRTELRESFISEMSQLSEEEINLYVHYFATNKDEAVRDWVIAYIDNLNQEQKNPEVIIKTLLKLADVNFSYLSNQQREYVEQIINNLLTYIDVTALPEETLFNLASIRHSQIQKCVLEYADSLNDENREHSTQLRILNALMNHYGKIDKEKRIAIDEHALLILNQVAQAEENNKELTVDYMKILLLYHFGKSNRIDDGLLLLLPQITGYRITDAQFEAITTILSKLEKVENPQEEFSDVSLREIKALLQFAYLIMNPTYDYYQKLNLVKWHGQVLSSDASIKHQRLQKLFNGIDYLEKINELRQRFNVTESDSDSVTFGLHADSFDYINEHRELQKTLKGLIQLGKYDQALKLVEQIQYSWEKIDMYAHMAQVTMDLIPNNIIPLCHEYLKEKYPLTDKSIQKLRFIDSVTFLRIFEKISSPVYQFLLNAVMEGNDDIHFNALRELIEYNFSIPDSIPSAILFLRGIHIPLSSIVLSLKTKLPLLVPDQEKIEQEVFQAYATRRHVSPEKLKNFFDLLYSVTKNQTGFNFSKKFEKIFSAPNLNIDTLILLLSTIEKMPESTTKQEVIQNLTQLNKGFQPIFQFPINWAINESAIPNVLSYLAKFQELLTLEQLEAAFFHFNKR